MSASNRYSNAKHWCTICRIFTQNDPKSIRMHEQALKHVGAVKRRLERAARIKDQGLPRDSRPFNEPSEAVEQASVTLREDEILGQYSIRGQVYLQGDYHEDLLLLPSSRCQVSLLNEDGEPGSWISCSVDSFETVEQTYVAKWLDQDTHEEVSANVSANDLRILGPGEPADPTQSWVTNARSEAESEQQNEENTEGAPAGTAREFYKGMRVAEDDPTHASVAESASTSTKPNGPVVFKKRARPSGVE
jgi:hypothetical protein